MQGMLALCKGWRQRAVWLRERFVDESSEAVEGIIGHIVLVVAVNDGEIGGEFVSEKATLVRDVV